jgi:hypothetical protein
VTLALYEGENVDVSFTAATTTQVTNPCGESFDYKLYKANTYTIGSGDASNAESFFSIDGVTQTVTVSSLVPSGTYELQILSTLTSGGNSYDRTEKLSNILTITVTNGCLDSVFGEWTIVNDLSVSVKGGPDSASYIVPTNTYSYQNNANDAQDD